MSEAASAGTTSTTGLSPLEPMLRDWLPVQRWFAGKGRRIGRLRMISAADLLPPGSSPRLVHLLLDVDGDCYQLLLGVRPALPPALAPALIGRAEQGRTPASASTRGWAIRGWRPCCWNGCAHPGPSARCGSTATRWR